jgi:hypothetical protein
VSSEYNVNIVGMYDASAPRGTMENPIFGDGAKEISMPRRVMCDVKPNAPALRMRGPAVDLLDVETVDDFVFTVSPEPGPAYAAFMSVCRISVPETGARNGIWTKARDKKW